MVYRRRHVAAAVALIICKAILFFSVPPASRYYSAYTVLNVTPTGLSSYQQFLEENTGTGIQRRRILKIKQKTTPEASLMNGVCVKRCLSSSLLWLWDDWSIGRWAHHRSLAQQPCAVSHHSSSKTEIVLFSLGFIFSFLLLIKRLWCSVNVPSAPISSPFLRSI